MSYSEMNNSCEVLLSIGGRYDCVDWLANALATNQYFYGISNFRVYQEYTNYMYKKSMLEGHCLYSIYKCFLPGPYTYQEKNNSSTNILKISADLKLHIEMSSISDVVNEYLFISEGILYTYDKDMCITYYIDPNESYNEFYNRYFLNKNIPAHDPLFINENMFNRCKELKLLYITSAKNQFKDIISAERMYNNPQNKNTICRKVK